MVDIRTIAIARTVALFVIVFIPTSLERIERVIYLLRREYAPGGVKRGLIAPYPPGQAFADLLASRDRATSAAELCDAVMARARDGRGRVGDPDWDDDRTVLVVRVLDYQTAASAMSAQGLAPIAVMDREKELIHGSRCAHVALVK